MIKGSLAVSALLSTSQAIQHQKVHTSEAFVKPTTPARRNVELEYHELGEEAIKVVYPKTLVNADVSASFQPTSCKSGIDRFQHGPSNTEAAWKAAKDKTTPWEDPEFGADDSSLSWGQFGFGQEEDAPPKGLKWKRPSEMGEGMTTSPSLWGKFGKPLPQGTQQGSLGDCWFLAACAALAEVPQRVEDVFVNQEYSKAGIFRVKFFSKKQFYYVNVDDRVPVRSWGKGFRPWATWPSKAGDAWWMPILEKAYAKFDQSYERIIAGNGAEGFRTLTGMPTFSIKHNGHTKSELYPIHKYVSAKNYPGTASCCNSVPGGIDGLVSGHAYSFLDVQELKDASGKVVHTIAKVRNPWGKEKYTGKFGDKDKTSWTAEWKKQVNLVDADDGIFWMPYENFIRFFRKVDVAYYQDYKTEYKHYVADNRQKLLKINNPVDQELYITGEMFAPRNYPRATKCVPKNNVVLYFEKNGRPIEKLKPYTFISWWGFGTTGKLAGKLPKGNYEFWIINQNAPNGPKDIQFQISAKEQLPTITGW